MAVTIDGNLGVTSPDFEPSSSTTPTNGLFLPAANTVGLATGSTERLRIDSSGNLGLGVTPSAWFTTNSKTMQFGGSSSLFDYSSVGNRQTQILSNAFLNTSVQWTYLNSDAASRYMQQTGVHSWYTAPSGTAGAAISFTQAMTLDASGNLGIGLTAPSVRLEARASIAGGSDNTIAIVHNYSDTGGDTRYSGLSFRIGSDNGTSAIRAYRTNSANNYETNLSFWTNPSGATTTPVQRVTIDSSGNLLVGTTSVSAVGSKISVKGNTVVWGLGPTSGNDSFFVYNASSVGVYLGNGSTSWSSSSDERLKTDLKPIENAAQKVSTLRAMTGRFKTDDEGVSRSFLIAQDVQAVLPEAVDSENPDKLGVRYTETIPLLVAAIKELTTRLEALENK